MDKNTNTPRTLIRTMQNDATIDKGDFYKKEAKDLIKSFVNVDKPLNNQHKKILEHASFDGYYPRIDDNVLKLERYTSENSNDTFINNNKTSDKDLYDKLDINSKADINKIDDVKVEEQLRRKDAIEKQKNVDIMISKPKKNINNEIKATKVKPNCYTIFESCLIFINITLCLGIFITVLFLMLYFIFLNHTLNIDLVLS